MFLSKIVPKFSATASMVGAVNVQSEMVREATEFGRLPLANPIRKAPSERKPLQFLTLTVSMMDLLGYPFCV